MSDRSFVDTNVFVYAVDRSDPKKRQRAQQVLAETADLTVSTQVMNEFYVVVTRKLAQPLPVDEAREMVEAMSMLNCVPVDADLVKSAVRIGQRWQLSHWDALMIAAAGQGGCDRILTEDLAEGACYEDVLVENPFS